jgi:hypothetical protein
MEAGGRRLHRGTGTQGDKTGAMADAVGCRYCRQGRGHAAALRDDAAEAASMHACMHGTAAWRSSSIKMAAALTMEIAGQRMIC